MCTETKRRFAPEARNGKQDRFRFSASAASRALPGRVRGPRSQPFQWLGSWIRILLGFGAVHLQSICSGMRWRYIKVVTGAVRAPASCRALSGRGSLSFGRVAGGGPAAVVSQQQAAVDGGRGCGGRSMELWAMLRTSAECSGEPTVVAIA